MRTGSGRSIVQEPHIGGPAGFHSAEQSVLFELWASQRKGRLLPARSDFGPFALRPWLGQLHLLDVIGAGADYEYRIHGTAVAERFGEMTGRRVSDWAGAIRVAAFETYGRVTRDGRPYLVRQNERARDRIVCNRRLVLPLSESGFSVSHLLVLVDMRNAADTLNGVEYHPLIV